MKPKYTANVQCKRNDATSQIHKIPNKSEYDLSNLHVHVCMYTMVHTEHLLLISNLNDRRSGEPPKRMDRDHEKVQFERGHETSQIRIEWNGNGKIQRFDQLQLLFLFLAPS